MRCLCHSQTIGIDTQPVRMFVRFPSSWTILFPFQTSNVKVYRDLWQKVIHDPESFSTSQLPKTIAKMLSGSRTLLHRFSKYPFGRGGPPSQEFPGPNCSKILGGAWCLLDFHLLESGPPSIPPLISSEPDCGWIHHSPTALCTSPADTNVLNRWKACHIPP